MRRFNTCPTLGEFTLSIFQSFNLSIFQSFNLSKSSFSHKLRNIYKKTVSQIKCKKNFNTTEYTKFATHKKTMVHKILYRTILLMISCKSEYQKLLTSTDYENSIIKPWNYTNKRRYYYIQLLEKVLPAFRLSDKAEK